MSEICGENVWFANFHHDDDDPNVRFTDDGIMQIRDAGGEWHAIRAAFRYVSRLNRKSARILFFWLVLRASDLRNPTLAQLRHAEAVDANSAAHQN